MQARLKVLHDKANVKQVKLLPVTLIGRSTECNLKIASSQVSRAHCRITLGDDTVYVEDLGSANGTLVDGKLLRPHQPTAIAPGATLVVGPAEFQVDYVASTSQTMVLSRSSFPIETDSSSTELIVPAAREAVIQQALPNELIDRPSTPAAAPVAAPVAKRAAPVARPVVAAPVIAPAVTPAAIVAAVAVPTAVAVAAASPISTTRVAPSSAPLAAVMNSFPEVTGSAEPAELLFAGFAAAPDEAVVDEPSPFDFNSAPAFGDFGPSKQEPSATTPAGDKTAGEKKGGLKSLFSMFGRGAKSGSASPPAAPAAVIPSVFLPTLEQGIAEAGSADAEPQEVSFGFEEPAAIDSSAQTLSFEPTSPEPISSDEAPAAPEDDGFSQFLNQF